MLKRGAAESPCGFTEDGKVLVRDPYRPNYDNWKLKNGLSYGFARSDIIQGYSGAWIFDKDALPEEPFIYGPNILPEDVVYFGQWAYNESVWGSIGGHIFCHYE